MKIHPSAVLETGCELGINIELGPYSVVHAGVQIGDGCQIGAHVVLLPYTRLGPDCRIHSGAVLGDLPQDLSFTPVVSRVEIGARCILREHVTVHRGTKEGTATVVGDDCYLMAHCHLAHNVLLGNRVILANGALLGGYVEVGDRAFLSGNVTIHQFVHIGRLAMVGGLSGISKDVPPFCTTEPLGLNRIAGLNTVGLKRAGFTPEQRLDIRRAFKRLYHSGLNTTQAVERLRKEFPSGPASEFVAFIEKSTRGLCGLGRETSE